MLTKACEETEFDKPGSDAKVTILPDSKPAENQWTLRINDRFETV